MQKICAWAEKKPISNQLQNNLLDVARRNCSKPLNLGGLGGCGKKMLLLGPSMDIVVQVVLNLQLFI